MNNKLLILAILTGFFTGIFIILYSFLTKALSYLLYFGNPYETIPHLPILYIYLVTFVSIFFVNFLISLYPHVKEYGVREIAESIEENEIIISIKDLFLKIFASAISLASGFAVGNEGPSSAIGAMIAHKFHSILKIPKALLRISIGIGASSGIAAIFVSPITGIIFALENIAYELVSHFVGYLILGSVISFSIAWQFLEPIVFEYSTGKEIDLKFILASIYFIPFMTFFVYLFHYLKDFVLDFLKNSILPQKTKILTISFISSIIIGTILTISPYGAFSGHELVVKLINNNLHLPLIMIIALIFLRIIATSVSLFANAVGGVFIAFMSIGALIGYSFAEIMNLFNYHLEPFYFSAIGAAVFMGVNMKLPLTAVVLALEITYDYNIVIPTGISVVIVTFIASKTFNIQKFH